MRSFRGYLTLFLLWSLVLLSVLLVAAQDPVMPDRPNAGDTVQVASGEETGFEKPFMNRYAERIIRRFDRSPLFITILYAVILYSIVTLITLLIIILLNRSKIQREEALRAYLLEQYQQKLMDYLFDDDKRDQAILELEQVATSKFRRQILIDQMIDLSINLKGAIKEEIRKLYDRLGLKRDTLIKINSKKWHEMVKGLRELAFMNIRDYNDRIIECLNSPNEVLRMEAQIAMVRLSDENPYQFLNYLQRPLAVWEQITLHELLVQHEMKVPAFKQWFGSDNKSVVMFALEMVAWFKQEDAGEEIIELFDNEDEEIRRTAFRVCGEIRLRPSLPVLREIYHREPYLNRLEILTTFARIPDEDYLEFLKSVLDSEEDVQLQILATKAMENTDEPGISMLIKLMKSKSEYKNYQIIIRHVLDGRIY